MRESLYIGRTGIYILAGIVPKLASIVRQRPGRPGERRVAVINANCAVATLHPPASDERSTPLTPRPSSGPPEGGPVTDVPPINQSDPPARSFHHSTLKHPCECSGCTFAHGSGLRNSNILNRAMKLCRVLPLDDSPLAVLPFI